MEGVGPLAAVIVNLAPVETLAPVRVAENVESGRDFLEFLFGLFVVGIAIRMVFLGELAKGGANLRIARLRGKPEHNIRVTRHCPLNPC